MSDFEPISVAWLHDAAEVRVARTGRRSLVRVVTFRGATLRTGTLFLRQRWAQIGS